jgi:hypothetical protein
MKKSTLHTRRHGLKLAVTAFSGRLLKAARSKAAAPELIEKIPAAPAGAISGEQFADSIFNVDRRERERAILDQLLKGNLPAFLRKLMPVALEHRNPAGKLLTATIFVMPEYLAIGADSDFLRIPMNLHTAVAVAERFGFLLPTRKMVDAIYSQCASRFAPQPLPAGPRMTSTEYYQMHNSLIDQQSRALGFTFGALAAGHKKDVVVTNRLIARPGQIAIYGWHRGIGDPIQPLSTVHGAGYADYSHGIRLVSRLALVEGGLRPVTDILLDQAFANVLSDEGTIRVQLALGIE